MEQVNNEDPWLSKISTAEPRLTYTSIIKAPLHLETEFLQPLYGDLIYDD